MKSSRTPLVIAALVGLLSPAYSSPINLDYGLVAHLSFDGNAQDVSGNGNDGTIVGLSWTTDRFGNANGALKADKNGYVQINNSTLLNGATSGAITGWFNNRLGPNEEGFIVGAGDSRAGLDPFALMLTGSNVTQSLFSETTKGPSASDRYIGFEDPGESVSIAQDQWTFFVMQFASIGETSIFQFYINGSLVHEYVNPYFFQIAYDQAMPVQIGALTGFQSVQFRGELDDFRFYDRALSLDEIAALNGNRVPDVGMTGLYLFLGLVGLGVIRRKVVLA